MLQLEDGQAWVNVAPCGVNAINKVQRVHTFFLMDAHFFFFSKKDSFIFRKVIDNGTVRITL